MQADANEDGMCVGGSGDDIACGPDAVRREGEPMKLCGDLVAGGAAGGSRARAAGERERVGGRRARRERDVGRKTRRRLRGRG